MNRFDYMHSMSRFVYREVVVGVVLTVCIH